MINKFNNFKDYGKAIGKAAEDASGNVSLDDLFNKEFMKKYSKLQTVDDMFDKAGIKIETEDDFNALSIKTLNSVVKKYTTFNSWDAMLGKAGEDYMANAIIKRLN